MEDELNRVLSFYDVNIKNMEPLNDNRSAYKLTDNADNQYFLKIYGKSNDYDIIPGRVYHTYEQVKLESEILLLLSDSVLNSAAPLKNRDGDFVTTLATDSDGEPMFAVITSFIDGITVKDTQSLTADMAYLAGVSAARLHLESKRELLPIAVKRPHKRQAYVRKIQEILVQGIAAGTLTATQYEMVSQCCDLIVDCMNRLDKDAENNVGLVHTDIQNTNIIYTLNHAALIDFSRSVYSYYLYDLAEMCLHADFGGSGPQLQNAVLRGYHAVKPLSKYDLFALQALFTMFILSLMAMGIESKQNAWLEGVLKWFTDEVHPGLLSGKGYLDRSVYENICAT